MNSELWPRIKPILDQALDLDPGERTAFVRAACEGQPDLQIEVESYLALEPELGDFITDPLVDLHEWSFDAAALVGSRIGPYLVTEEVGRGGIGIVYRAQRCDGEFDRRVAIKVLKRGLETEELVRRFELERHILARLEHPNIASLLDAGSLPDGRPYLVMEFVEGQPIDLWCERQGSSIENRITLFLEVCEAVRFAHQRLVIHRDLKPGNILVTDDGRPKLLDFGIARLVDPVFLPMASLYPLRIMTLEYASPEQVAGGTVTTASDVYSLGVLLFRLLGGRSPYRSAAGDRASLEWEVRLGSPPRLSSVVQGGGRLRGDLETIVAKALQKEPDRRYGSPEQLADDLRRHLAGLPVLAQPDSLAYRAGKFVRRHKIAVGSATLALALLGTFAGVTYASLQKSDRERRNSERVRNFLVELFQNTDPKNERGETLTARELLDRGVEKIDGFATQDPESAGELLETLGRVRGSLGNHEVARGLLERALQLKVAVHGEESRAVIPTKHNLGLRLLELGQLDEAERVISEALATQRKLGSTASDPEYLSGLNNLGGVYQQREQWQEAARTFSEVVALKREARVPPADLATSINNLAGMYSELEDLARAEPLYRESLALRIGELGVDKPSPEVARAMNNLAVLLEKTGGFEEATDLYEQALAMRRQLYPSGHPGLVKSLANLGTFQQKLGRLDRAEDLLEEAVAMPALGQLGVVDQARVLGYLAEARLAQGHADCVAPAAAARALLAGITSPPAEVVAQAERTLAACRAVAPAPSVQPSSSGQ